MLENIYIFGENIQDAKNSLTQQYIIKFYWFYKSINRIMNNFDIPIF